MAYRSVADAVKALGEKQALNDLNKGEQQRLYRKKRNMERDAIVEMVKSDPDIEARIRAKIAAEAAKQKKTA